MYSKPMLGVDQCQAAINAMIEEFKKDPTRPPIAMAIVDDTGNLLSYARTDRCAISPARNAIKKAYTSAIRRLDSGAYAEQLKQFGASSADMGDPMLIPLQGALVVVNPSDGAILGAIGVGGLPSGPADEHIARVGLEAMNL